jgi:hypothetical protein
LSFIPPLCTCVHKLTQPVTLQWFSFIFSSTIMFSVCRSHSGIYWRGHSYLTSGHIAVLSRVRGHIPRGSKVEQVRGYCWAQNRWKISTCLGSSDGITRHTLTHHRSMVKNIFQCSQESDRKGLKAKGRDLRVSRQQDPVKKWAEMSPYRAILCFPARFNTRAGSGTTVCGKQFLVLLE